MIRNIHSKWLYIVLALSAIWTFTYLGQFYQPEPVQQRTVVATPKTVLPEPQEIDTNVIFKLVNKERTERGIPALTKDPVLEKTAKQKCDDMVKYEYYGHVNPETGVRGLDYVVKVKTDNYLAENLNQAFSLDKNSVFTNRETVDSWLRSPKHNEAMLDNTYINTGLAYCMADHLKTVVQHFSN